MGIAGISLSGISLSELSRAANLPGSFRVIGSPKISRDEQKGSSPELENNAGVKVSFSAEAMGLMKGELSGSSLKPPQDVGTAPTYAPDLSPEDKARLNTLKQRDMEVKRHEQAHVSVGGNHVMSGPSYTYATGPDGRQYAVGGEVAIDVSPVPDDPEATIAKARIVKRAALAPASPSPADRQVAAKAAAMERTAISEQAKENRDELEEGSLPGSLTPNSMMTYSRPGQEMQSIDRAGMTPLNRRLMDTYI